LIGAGAGLSLTAALRGTASSAQTTGTPEILTSGEYPIGLWWPPPPGETTVARYREIAAAGFNFVIGGNGVSNDASIPDALDAAAENDLRFLLTDNPGSGDGLQDIIRSTTRSTVSEAAAPSIMQRLLEQSEAQQPSSAATEPSATSPRGQIRQRVEYLLTRYGGESALAGFNLYDEPHRSMFGLLGFAKTEVTEQSDGSQLPYANIWPSHTASSALGTRTYERYLELYFSEVDPDVLSFDHYPLLAKGITSDYFYNWAVIRRFSRTYDVPSWVFIQSVGFDGSKVGLGRRRRPNEAEIFWQINVSLAYGAKGIQYFTYWTPSDPRVDFKDALVTRGGQLTSLYQYATNANEYLKVMGRELLPLTSESVVHARESRLPRGAKAFKADNWVRAVNGSPVILGRFFRDSVDDPDRYLFVANRSLAKVAETRLTLADSISRVSELDIEAEDFVEVTPTGDPPRNLSLRIGPGKAQLYRLETN
jgi:hypothetical protein